MMCVLFMVVCFWVLVTTCSAVDFDGSNDEITCPHSAELNITTNLTWCGWVKAASGGNSIQYLAMKGSGGIDQFEFLWKDGSNISLYIGFGGFPGVSAAQPSLDAWHFITGWWDGSTAKIYSDGSELVSGSISGTANSNTYEYQFAHHNNNLRHFKGKQAGHKYYTEALSVPEMESIRFGQNQIPRAKLHWLLTEESGTNLSHPDLSGNGNTGTGAGGAAGTTDNPPITWHSFGGN